MTNTLTNSAGALNPAPVTRAQAGAGRFMVTLCTLAAPVAIRPPQSPRLRHFTFFTSRACLPDRTERLYLHVGYFDTLADAERWADSARRQYPGAFAAIAPGVPLRPTGSETSSAPRGASRAVSPHASNPAPINYESLTDSQVLKVLEARRAPFAESDAGGSDLDQVALLRPEDTVTRQVLREAVSRGAPVSFAVQLRWSAEPIDLDRVRPLPIFKSHTLYATDSRREGHCRYFLRLGFFADPLSAKQVAAQVRPTFESAAVVPVIEPEITRAREAGRGTSAIPYLGTQRVDQQIDFSGMTASPMAPKPPVAAPSHRSERSAADMRSASPAAGRDELTEPDSLSESGVRHLRVEVQENLSGRWKIIRLSEPPPSEVQFY